MIVDGGSTGGTRRWPRPTEPDCCASDGAMAGNARAALAEVPTG